MEPPQIISKVIPVLNLEMSSSEIKVKSPSATHIITDKCDTEARVMKVSNKENVPLSLIFSDSDINIVDLVSIDSPNE